MKEGWEYKKLSLVCYKITDGSHFSPKVDNNGIYPMLSVKDMMAIGFNYTTCKYINENDYNVLVANGCKPKVNDVLVAKDGSYLKTAFVLKEDKEQALLSSIAIITPRLDEIVPEYLAFYFKAPYTKSVVEKHYLTGTAIKRVILKGFKNITIPVPPLSEQQHIVEELDLLSSIIEKKKAQLNELDNLAQSLFYEMFCSFSANTAVSTYILSLSGGKSLAGKEECVNKVLKTGAVTYDFFDGNEVKNLPVDYIPSQDHLLHDGDILISRMNTLEYVGACAYVWKAPSNTYLPDRLWRAKLKDNVNPIYLWFSLIQDSVKEQIRSLASGTSGSMKNISIPRFLSVKIKNVPLPLQQQFASKIEAIEHQKELIKQSIKEVETLFNSRMDYYFN